MNGFVENIESIAVGNGEYRRVLDTATNCQLVVMALKSKEELGAEVHELDILFRRRAAAACSFGKIPSRIEGLYRQLCSGRAAQQSY